MRGFESLDEIVIQGESQNFCHCVHATNCIIIY